MINPIIVRELRSRMRGPRAFIILTGFLLLLGVFAYGLYRLVVLSSGVLGSAPAIGAVVGRSLFAGLAFLELMLVCFISPALTASGISAEAERRTLDMLLATPLSAGTILWGKLVSSLVYVLLLVLAAIPMASIVFVFGGVTLADMLSVLTILALCAAGYGMLGLFFSAWLRRTGRATLASYTVVLLLMFGSYALYIFVGVTRQAIPPRVLLLGNPLAALASAVGGEAGPGLASSISMSGPFLPLIWAMSGSLGAVVNNPAAANLASQRPLWHYTAGLQLLGTAALFLLSVQLLKPVRRWRLGRRALLGLALGILLVAGAGYLFYGPPSYAALGHPALAAPTPVPTPMPAVPPMPPAPVRVFPGGRVIEAVPTATPVGGGEE